jgi:hypothetical protein
MPASAYLETAMLELLNGVSLTAPADLYVALCEEEQTRDLSSTTLKAELAYTGYERVQVKPEAGKWEITTGTAGAISKAVNKALIEMLKNTGANEKNKAKNFALVGGTAGQGKNAGTAGKLYFYGSLSEALEIVKALTKVEFPAKALEVSSE